MGGLRTKTTTGRVDPAKTQRNGTVSCDANDLSQTICSRTQADLPVTPHVLILHKTTDTSNASPSVKILTCPCQDHL